MFIIIFSQQIYNLKSILIGSYNSAKTSKFIHSFSMMKNHPPQLQYQITNSQTSSSFNLLLKVQQKLQSLVIKISNNNSTLYESSVQDNQNNGTQLDLKPDKQNKITYWQKCSQILYQIQILEILLAENNLSTFRNLTNNSYAFNNQTIKQVDYKFKSNINSQSNTNDNKWEKVRNSKTIKDNTGIYNIQSSIAHSLHLSQQTEKQKAQTLKQTLLSLCDQVKLQQSSKKFLKSQIQSYFSDKEQKKVLKNLYNNNNDKNDKFKLNDQEATQQFLQSFITQIGQLKDQIENLRANNQKLNKQKQILYSQLSSYSNIENLYKISKFGFPSNNTPSNTKFQAFQNPQLKKNHPTDLNKLFRQQQKLFSRTSLSHIDGDLKAKHQTYPNPTLKTCPQCIKHQQEAEYYYSGLQNAQQSLIKNQNTIKQMNTQFSQQIIKYNKVFQRLSTENEQLKRYLDYQIRDQILKLQQEIQILKVQNYKIQLRARSNHQGKNNPFEYQNGRNNIYQYEGNRKKSYLYQNQNNYPQVGIQRNPISGKIYFNKNISSQNYLKQNLYNQFTSRSRVVQPQNRSKSRYSHKNTRPNSYRSCSPNQKLLRPKSKKLFKPYLQKLNPNEYQYY